MPYKLLLADDSVTIQRVIELTFAGEDVNVVAVGDGEQAIARIPVERPDIVLADIGMPKRSGYDVSAFVKGQPELRHIPVLLLAGAFEPVDEAKAEQAGCDGVLVKPFEPQHVIARVRELLEGIKGSPTQAAAADVARPVERLTAREPRPAPVAAAAPQPAAPRGPEPVPDASLDDYFDRLDAAFATMGGAAPGPAMGLPDPDLDVPTLDEVLADAPLAPPPPFVHTPPAVQPPPVEPPDASPTLTEAPPAPAMAAASVSAASGSLSTVASGPAPAVPSGSAPAVASGSTPAVASGSPFAVASGFSRKDDGTRNDDGGRNVIADVFTMMLAAEQGEPGAAPLRLSLGPQEPVVTEAMIEEVTRRVLQRLAPDTARSIVVDVVSEVAERLVRQEIARIRGTQ